MALATFSVMLMIINLICNIIITTVGHLSPAPRPTEKEKHTYAGTQHLRSEAIRAHYLPIEIGTDLSPRSLPICIVSKKDGLCCIARELTRAPALDYPKALKTESALYLRY
jgi:hypothetical protein